MEATIGIGQHKEVVSSADIRLFLLTSLWAELVYCLSLATTKISIILLYASIFSGQKFALGLKIVAAFVVTWALAVVITTIFSCKPVHASWDFIIPSVCINKHAFLIGRGVPNIVADIIILYFPMREVWRLQLALKGKIAVLGLFLLGGLSVSRMKQWENGIFGLMPLTAL